MKPIVVVISFLFNVGITNTCVFSQDIQQISTNYYVAGIPSLEFYVVAAIGEQRCPEWCWAASSQMILNYHGLYVSQEQIVRKIFGSVICQPGTNVDIQNALSGWAPDTKGGFSQIYSQEGISSVQEIIQNLAYKCPLLVCLSINGAGHAEVMTAIYYSFDQYHNPIIDKVVLRDPWPHRPSLEEMSWQEFSNKVTDIFKVWVTRL